MVGVIYVYNVGGYMKTISIFGHFKTQVPLLRLILLVVLCIRRAEIYCGICCLGRSKI